MFDIVYDGMLSTKGIAGAAVNIVRRRQKRYYRILARAGAKVEELRLLDPLLKHSTCLIMSVWIRRY
jgi:hypothetical protein